jgi:hypothetical protein
VGPGPAAYAAALHPVFLGSAAVAAAGIGFALMLRPVPLRQEVGPAA